MKSSKIKVIKSKNSIEILEYEKPVEYDYKYKGKMSRPARSVPDDPRYEIIKKINRGISNNRARSILRRIIENNFEGQKSKFVTLTFASNVTSVACANQHIKKFIQRLRYNFGKEFKYVWVMELTQTGRIHYHLLWDIPYDFDGEAKSSYTKKIADLNHLWGHGWTTIADVMDLSKLIGYMTKNMTPDAQEERFYGEKIYSASRNMEREEVLRGEEAEMFLQSISLDAMKLTRKNQFDTRYNGKGEYKKYEITPGIELREEVIKKVPRTKVNKIFTDRLQAMRSSNGR